MIGELISGIINAIVGVGRLFNNRLVVLLKSQSGLLVRRRNRYAIIVGEIEKPQYIVKITKKHSKNLNLMELDNEIFDLITNPAKYSNALLVSI